jgi:hypothetical protein
MISKFSGAASVHPVQAALPEKDRPYNVEAVPLVRKHHINIIIARVVSGGWITETAGGVVKTVPYQAHGSGGVLVEIARISAAAAYGHCKTRSNEFVVLKGMQRRVIHSRALKA